MDVNGGLFAPKLELPRHFFGSKAKFDRLRCGLAKEALLTMACDSRGTWSSILLDFLKEEGMSQLLHASTRSGDEERDGTDPSRGLENHGRWPLRGQRLVVELLLRGFEGPVVQRFALPELVTERKRLLNELFMSSDGFVRVTVGILLAALLTDAEDYGEAGPKIFGKVTQSLGCQAGLVPLPAEPLEGLERLEGISEFAIVTSFSKTCPGRMVGAAVSAQTRRACLGCVPQP
eukprot:s611_g7.t1